MSPLEAAAAAEHAAAARALSCLERWHREQDVDALDELLRLEVADLKRRIRHRGRRLLSASSSASDYVHQAVANFVRLRPAPHFDGVDQFRGYLWKSAWRLLLQRVRTRQRRARTDRASRSRLEALLYESGGQRSVETAERNGALAFALHLLQDADRAVLELTYFEGLDLAALAARLDVRKEAAAMRLVRARRRLADKLKAWQELID